MGHKIIIHFILYNRVSAKRGNLTLMGATWLLPAGCPMGNLIFLGVVKACTWSASAWSVLWNGGKGGVECVNWLLFVLMKDISTQWGWFKMADDTLQPTLQFLPRTYICNVIILNFVPNKWNCIGQGNDLAHNRIQNVTWASHNPVHWPIYMLHFA